jgi:hypothetical protein
MREPDESMTVVGDEATWSSMIDAALSKYSFEGDKSLGGGDLVE